METDRTAATPPAANRIWGDDTDQDTYGVSVSPVAKSPQSSRKLRQKSPGSSAKKKKADRWSRSRKMS